MTSFRRAAVHLALVALMLRALLPAGWMPNPVADGTPLVICTMDGPVQAADGKSKPADPRAHEVCPFAAAAHLAPPQHDVNFAAPAFAASLATTSIVSAVADHRARFQPQSPRAPPVIA